MSSDKTRRRAVTKKELTKDKLALGDLEVTRMGYGAMQLAGPKVYGPPVPARPRDRHQGRRSPKAHALELPAPIVARLDGVAKGW
jgi:hypothetical protein